MKYNEDTLAVETSVRSLCERALRGGDLGDFFSADGDAKVDGGEVHRRLQAEAGGFYNAEVSLSNTTLYEGLYFTVSGRADGVIRHGDGVEVDEIKCVHSYDFFLPPREVFLAQMKCYAYFLALREELTEIRARLTYYHIETKKIKYFHYHFTTRERRAFYEELLGRVVRFARLLVRRKIETLPSAAWVKFPYSELREGQEMMIRESYRAIRKGKRLFVEAPTGTGKTMSSLYPAVRALGRGEVDKIFYLTAKASTRREAYRAASLLFEAGAKLRVAVITAKEQLCTCQGGMKNAEGRSQCNGEDCPRARGYYDRLPAALLELLESKNGYSRQIICEVAGKHGICPYEFSLDLSEYCDIVICDYNYAFDPSVYFRRYFGDGGAREKYVFLIDEAHNLADRAREMYSAILFRSEFQTVLSKLPAEEKTLVDWIYAAEMAVGRLRELCREEIVKDAEGNERGFYLCRAPLENLNTELEIFRRRIDPWLKKNPESPYWGPLSELASHVRKYLSVNEFFEEGFLSYVELSGGDLSVKTYCLDPSPIMDSLLHRARASILFSATLTPSEYFCDVLGGAKSAESISLPSPFAPERLSVAVADYLSVRFDDRAKNDARYAAVIAATVSAKAGNYIAYFPSYELLERVRTAFCKKYPKVEVIVQKQGMGLREKEEFLGSFQEDRGHLRVGFCVLGGAFSEGVDLPGSRLIGSIIFGVGIPGISNERNMIQEYFDKEESRGYDYAYTYPGMTRVLQAVGRVIRQENDRGIAVLVDDRYATPKYRAMFPAHWQGVQYAGNARSLAEIMRRFWENSEKTEKN